MSRIGILGGGQLARMLALAAIPLGIRVSVLDQNSDACARSVADLTVADFGDREAVAAFADEVDVVTFDFENVPGETARWLADRVPVYPSPDALAVAQDRLSEKNLFNDIGLATPSYAAVDSRAGLDAALAAIGLPAVLKTRRLGYDGKGQFRIVQAADADAAWSALGGNALILERFIAFDRELSIVGVRGRNGDFRAWAPIQNWHEDGILSASLSPIPALGPIGDEALAIARQLAERLDYVGVFALELFDDGGRLLGNELAPRVHNSGHLSIEGAVTSQFENHLRAVLGWPLGDTAARGAAAMLNFIGALPANTTALAVPGVHWHDYGKSTRAGRKVGHVTLTADPSSTLRAGVDALCAALDRERDRARIARALSG